MPPICQLLKLHHFTFLSKELEVGSEPDADPEAEMVQSSGVYSVLKIKNAYWVPVQAEVKTLI